MPDLSSGASEVSWVPDEAMPEIIWVKGILTLVGAMLFMWHLHTMWPCMRTDKRGKRLRYLTLLMAALVSTYRSVDQVQAHDYVFRYPDVWTLAFAVLLIVASVVSLREERSTVQRRKKSGHDDASIR